MSNYHQALIEECALYTHDPLGFVYFAYPWGEEGTVLEHESGPNYFQKSVLTDIGNGLIKDPHEAIKLSNTSGHGVGKSALVSWIGDHQLSTFPEARGVITANTEIQLRTKTWSEITKWHNLSITRGLFHMAATSRYSIFKHLEKTWRFDMVPWSERNTEAFAGLHNYLKRVFLLMDEASAIHDVVWEVADGALTDAYTELLWAVFGNPTRATGEFRQCFPGGKQVHRWKHRKVDSRSVPQTNKEYLQELIDDYGIDSDRVKSSCAW